MALLCLLVLFVYFLGPVFLLIPSRPPCTPTGSGIHAYLSQLVCLLPAALPDSLLFIWLAHPPALVVCPTLSFLPTLSCLPLLPDFFACLPASHVPLPMCLAACMPTSLACIPAPFVLPAQLLYLPAPPCIAHPPISPSRLPAFCILYPTSRSAPRSPPSLLLR